MKIKSTEIVDTFAEAFKMSGSRIIITAESKQWAMAAAQSITGFATSVIGCKCEAGIEKELLTDETPDNRPGISVLIFAMDADGLGKRLTERIGQCVMTCPTTACFNGLESNTTAIVGGQLRYFGDGHQSSKVLGKQRLWRIPVMDGEFVVDERFGIQDAVGGGNILILGKDQKTTLKAATAATKAMREIDGVVLPFPNGVVRSGSKVGSKYKALIASSNDAYCPTLRTVTNESLVPEGVNCVLEIVIDGLTEAAVADAMRVGLHAAAKPGIKQLSAGNYGGNLGQYHLHLNKILEAREASNQS
ncbi:MAG: formylmethanofuran--tetrahydromethanopterin N-formyltransferase [Proteobacteria bacterium]|nr:formylmethanofuran--tetrahydromethanopterin N-formyltransferase [Pseudomonadota bacterium]MCH9047792.1 formylmethanofuran--tetrahydromethanopterin N-formyltransferase [Pseudomonadota bacterium]